MKQMSMVVLFGTESGTAEFVAMDVAKQLKKQGKTAVSDLGEYQVSDLTPDNFYFVICSTYGEGDPPATVRPFLKEIDDQKPDLTGLRFAVFGMGDSSYKASYSRGSEVVANKFIEYGAARVGPYGRHDASGVDDATDLALEWAQDVMAFVPSDLEKSHG